VLTRFTQRKLEAEEKERGYLRRRKERTRHGEGTWTEVGKHEGEPVMRAASDREMIDCLGIQVQYLRNYVI
jgi:hypothetical protein